MIMVAAAALEEMVDDGALPVPDAAAVAAAAVPVGAAVVPAALVEEAAAVKFWGLSLPQFFFSLVLQTAWAAASFWPARMHSW